MQAVDFIGIPASGVLCYVFSFFLFAFFSPLPLRFDESIGDRIRGCFFGGEYIIPGSFGHSLFVYKPTCMRIQFSLYPSSQRRSMGCKKEEREKRKERASSGGVQLPSGVYWFTMLYTLLHYCIAKLHC